MSCLTPHSGADCGPAAGARRAAPESGLEERPPTLQAQPRLGILSTFVLRKIVAIANRAGWLTTLLISSVRAPVLPTQSGIFCPPTENAAVPKESWEPRSRLPR